MNSIPPGSGPRPDVEYFQELADGAPVLIWMSGLDMGCFYFNRAWLDFRGRTLEQEFGNGWAEGVHPDDLERCVQHYVSSFEKKAAFAMSYRLQHFSGEYRWILDRGVPHFGADGAFLGFYGGCAETHAEATSQRMAELRLTIRDMGEFAGRVALAEAQLLPLASRPSASLEAKTRDLQFQHLARQNAAVQMEKLAIDMLSYDQIDLGACLR